MTDRNTDPSPPAVARSAHPLRRQRWLLFVPIALAGLLVGMFAFRLIDGRDDRVPSRLVGGPVPALSLPAATGDRPGIADPEGHATGSVRLVNIFASWCTPCRAEAPSLDAIARAGVAVDGIAVRDTPEALATFLKETGNPYRRIGADVSSDAMLSLGAAGVPETFIVDGKGIVRRQIQAPILPADVPALLAEIRAMEP